MLFMICNLTSYGYYSPWASGRSGDTGWPDSNTADNAPDGKDSQWPTPAQPSLTDLVPEFEPGKPWKVLIVFTFPLLSIPFDCG